MLSFIEELTAGLYECDLLLRQAVEIVDEAVDFLARDVYRSLEAGLLALMGPSQRDLPFPLFRTSPTIT